MTRLRATRGGAPTRIVPAVSTILFAFALICSCEAQDNLLENSSFEALDATKAAPAGWTAWADPNYAVYTLADARSGVACVAITDPSEKVSQGLRSPRVPIEAGKRYRASAWTRIESGPRPAAALYLEYWAGNTRVENKSVSTSDAPDWRELTLSVAAPEGATHATVLVYSASVSIGRAYFDDLTLVEEPAP